MGIYEDWQIHTKTGFRPIKLQESRSGPHANRMPSNNRDYYSVPGIIRISGIITQYQGLSGITWELSVSRLDDHAQHYELSVKTKKMVQVLLDFKANWREFYDHSYFRDLTSNRRRLGK